MMGVEKEKLGTVDRGVIINLVSQQSDLLYKILIF